ncbi:MAG: tRNA lysidine(34) synthetase TilS [Ruminococcus sp.]|nr:tRNA lysidine(34) synthetase TilS [Ruminococcus sp.]
MVEKVKSTIEKYSMLSEGDPVLCGLSGGADSTALLLCLYELGCNVSACHINHGLRGEEADRDEQFCRELCERLGVPFTAVRIDVRAFVAETGKSVEEAARELRYREFAKLTEGRLATAHTLSDSLETALFNLARGTGAKGLCGIPPVRGEIIRPLIECTRAEVEAFLAERGQSFVTDSTNLTDEYTRNRLRHGAVPVLKGINPAAEQAFLRLSESLSADDEYLFREAERLLSEARGKHGYTVKTLAQAEQPVLSRAVMLLLSERSLPYDTARVTELCGMIRKGQGRVTLSRDICALASQGEFRIAEPEKPVTDEIKAVPDCEFELTGKTVSLRIIKNAHSGNKVHKMFTYIALDYDKIKGELAVRTRRAGDSIRLAGRGCTKSIKKLFSEQIPLEKREAVLLLCDSEGVIAVEGIGAAERCAPDENTENILCFQVSIS